MIINKYTRNKRNAISSCGQMSLREREILHVDGRSGFYWSEHIECRFPVVIEPSSSIVYLCITPTVSPWLCSSKKVKHFTTRTKKSSNKKIYIHNTNLYTRCYNYINTAVATTQRETHKHSLKKKKRNDLLSPVHYEFLLFKLVLCLWAKKEKIASLLFKRSRGI